MNKWIPFIGINSIERLKFECSESSTLSTIIPFLAFMNYAIQANKLDFFALNVDSLRYCNEEKNFIKQFQFVNYTIFESFYAENDHPTYSLYFIIGTGEQAKIGMRVLFNGYFSESKDFIMPMKT
uniref:Uncharacterized protein n=1 Tax=Rhabditophanes sp. KR3021 TaxID=114890 RepID=A0AC35U0B2_9BILA